MAFVYWIFFVVFFGGSLETYNILPPVINWSTELVVYGLLVYTVAIRGKNLRLPLVFWIVCFIVACGASIVYNSQFNIKPLLSLRIFIRFYVFFIAVVNMRLTNRQIKHINRVLAYIFILQLPVVAVKFAVFGQSEITIGTYSTTGGSLTTMLPIFAIGYLLSFYLYFKGKTRYLLLCLGFFSWVVMGNKRGFMFFFPVMLSFLSMLVILGHKRDRNTFRRIRQKLLIVSPVLLAVVVVCSVRYIPTLNPERMHGGSLDLEYLKSFATEKGNDEGYMRKHGQYTGGRISTTVQVFRVMASRGVYRILFGYGPGAYTGSRFLDERQKRGSILHRDIKIIYGVTPLTYLTMEYGVFGAVVFLGMILHILVICVRSTSLETDPYWKAYTTGTTVFAFMMVIFWLSYHPPSFTGDTVPAVYYYCISVVFSRVLTHETASASRLGFRKEWVE